MKQNLEKSIPVLEGVQVTIDGNTLTTKGKEGELTREFRFPGVSIEQKDGNVLVLAPNGTKRQKVLVATSAAHITNMMKGVMEGFEYELKVCSGHFPMTVSFANGMLTVKNYIGEAVPRTLEVNSAVKLTVEGDIIKVWSVDKELAGQTAGRIEKLCKRANFDNRIFQDGIYITSKAGKAI